MKIKFYINNQPLNLNTDRDFSDFDEAFCCLNYYASEHPDILNNSISFKVTDNYLSPLAKAEFVLKSSKEEEL